MMLDLPCTIRLIAVFLANTLAASSRTSVLDSSARPGNRNSFDVVGRIPDMKLAREGGTDGSIAMSICKKNPLSDKVVDIRGFWPVDGRP